MVDSMVGKRVVGKVGRKADSMAGWLDWKPAATRVAK
jgi:hypothetical protein